MRRIMFLIVVGGLTAFFFFSGTPGGDDDAADPFADTDGELLLPQRNVAIAVVDLDAIGRSFTDPATIAALRPLQQDFIELPGVSKVESILNISRVFSEGEDIIVSRAIPEDQARVTEAYLETLESEIDDFPELAPFINPAHDTLLFYVYFSNRTPPSEIHEALTAMRDRWAERVPFEFTGRAPILAETARLLTGDITLFLPLLALMVTIIFSLFRRVRVVVISLVLVVLSIAAAYGLVRFLGIPDSPLILLIPVFSLGLLSDYMLHYYYHALFTPLGEDGTKVRRHLLFPLSLTALSTVTGFLSLSFINGTGHLQLGVIIAAAVVVTWVGVFFWIHYIPVARRTEPLLVRFQRFQGRLFGRIAGHRGAYLAVVLAAVIWGAFQIPNLSIEPYPVEQLPPTTTVKQADLRINEEFYGTVPYFIEVDTGTSQGILRKDTLLALDEIHTAFDEGGVGYTFSLLTVLKRMNFYFMGSEETLLTSTEFDDIYDALIEQYLLYYSSSVDPAEYESLLDASYRVFSIRGLIYYRNSDDLARFVDQVDRVRADLPEGWSLSMHGMASQLETERQNLRNNWVISFAAGSIMIFLTVLVFYRRLALALISLVPGVISMVISFGVIAVLGIRIDAFSIIFVAIITGLVIDYSIHTLVALNRIDSIPSLAEGFREVVGYSGIPIFLSFLTSLLSFSVLFLSSFRGARTLGFLLFASLVLSFFLSLYLLPLILLPNRLPKEINDEKR